MPNYVQNVITFSKDATEEEILGLFDKVLRPQVRKEEIPILPETANTGSEELSVLDYSSMVFDFNNLIPMPESLDIVSGTETEIGMYLHKKMEQLPKRIISYIKNSKSYQDVFHDGEAEKIKAEYHFLSKNIHPDVCADPMSLRTMVTLNTYYQQAFLSKGSFSSACSFWDFLVQGDPGWEVERLKRYLSEQNIPCDAYNALPLFIETEEGKKLFELGEICADNIAKYGAPTWYEWCCANWGTKWNACDSVVNADERTIEFQTAWSCPEPIVEKLADLFPNVDFTWCYADEDCGNNVGKYIHCNGILTEEEIFSGTSEAYAMYVKCWGENDCLYQDEDGNWNHYDCDTCPHPC